MTIAVVTGGVRGIGRAIVQKMCARGDMVYATDVLDSNDPLVAALPTGCQYRQVDSSDQEQVDAFIKEVAAEHGSIDVLVNNAGITADGLAVRQSKAQWEKVVAVNLNGTFWYAQAALKQMVAQRNGVIINMSSVVASTGNPGQVNYAASKAGVEAITKTLAREYGARGIRVNAVAPGFIATPMTQALPEKVQQLAIDRTSLRRAGTPEEVAALILFLSSSDSAYITGQIIHINGGIW